MIGIHEKRAQRERIWQYEDGRITGLKVLGRAN